MRLSWRRSCASGTMVGLVLALAGVGAAPAAASTGCPAPNGDAYSQAILADNPIAYYRLDELGGTVMCDSSSSQNNGTYSSTGITYGVSGPLADGDPAIAVDGQPVGQSDADPVGLTGNHDFTLEAWFRNTETPANHVLVSIGETCSYEVAGPSCSGTDGQAAALALFPNQNGDVGWGPSSCFGIDQLGSNMCWDPSSIGVNLWDGNWHYLTVTYDAGTDQFAGYVDGQQLTTLYSDPYFTPAVNLAAAPIMLGQWFNSYHLPLDDDLAEVAVYPTALSAARIAAHYAAAGEEMLKVTTAGSGTGTVTSSPTGIRCGSACSAAFGAGAQVTLTASPTPGSTFSGWSGGGCSGTAATCELVLSGNETVTATFSQSVGAGQPVSVTTTLNGGGQSAQQIVVAPNTPVFDQATLSGPNTATAGGTLTYNVYSDPGCTVAAAAPTTLPVTDGVVGPSSTLALPPGTYFYRAYYSGDANNLPQWSTCGWEILVVLDGGRVGADMGAAVEALPGSQLTSGTTFEIDVTATDYGPDAAKNVVTALLLPKGMSVVNAGGATEAGRLLVWRRTSFGLGQTVTYQVWVNPSGSGSLALQAGTFSLGTADPNDKNNFTAETVTENGPRHTLTR